MVAQNTRQLRERLWNHLWRGNDEWGMAALAGILIIVLYIKKEPAVTRTAGFQKLYLSAFNDGIC